MLRLARFRIAAALYGLAERCYDFGNRCSPPDDVSVPFDPEQWTDLGYTTDAGVTFADAYREWAAPMREAAEHIRAHYLDGIGDVLRVASSPIPESMWRDPAPRDIEGVKEVVREAYENGQPVEPAVMAKLTAPIKVNEHLFGPFEHTDLAPYLEQFDNMVRDVIRANADAKEQTMAAWLDDVGTVVPGFDADAARQIVAERDRFLP
jgi:hypothetical protein